MVVVTGTGTVTSTPPGISCYSDWATNSCTTSFPVGTDVTLATDRSATSLELQDTPGACGPNTCRVVMTQDATLEAIFPSMPPLTVTVSGPGVVLSAPAGIDCYFNNSPCTARFPLGTVVTLSAAPANCCGDFIG